MTTPANDLQNTGRTAKGMARRVLVVGVIVAGTILALGITSYLRYGRTEPDPPGVPEEGLEPAVRAAIEEARASVRQSRRSANAWGQLGMILFAHGFSAEAEACFVQAEQLDLPEPRWPYYQGVILSLKDSEAAIPKWQRAVELWGDSADSPRLRLADALLQLGRSEEALSHYQHLLQHQASHPLAHLGLARLAFERGAFSDSLAHLQRSATSPFAQTASHRLMAAVYQRLGDQRAADQQLRAVAGLPEDAAWPDPLSQALAELRVDKRSRLKQASRLLDQNRVREGLAALDRLVRDEPDFDPAWRALGFALFQQGDYANAGRALRVALGLAPDSVEALYYLGCVAMNQGQPTPAMAYFRRATALKPDYALAHYNLGQCLKLQGDRPGAIEAFRAAVRCRPYLAEAHRNLGELLAQNGQTTEALDHLRHAAALDPADQETKKLLKQLQSPAVPSNKSE